MNRALAGLLGLVFSVAVAAQASDQTIRIRGTIDQIDAKSMVVKDREGKKTPLVYADDLMVVEVLPIDPALFKRARSSARRRCRTPTARWPRSRSTFPKSARHRRGHRPFDLQPGSTMTNATVAAVKPGTSDRVVTLRYKDGEKTIHVPNGIPIVTLKAGDKPPGPAPR